MKNIITIIAAALLLLTAAAVSAEDAHQLIYGASTEISGDFAPGALWTNNVTDALIRSLTNDYDCVASDRGGALMVNPTVCEGIENEMTKDGTKTFTITIKDGLLFNNGEPITIKDFVWLTAFASSPVATELGAKVTTYMMLKGGQEYYDGTAATISGLRWPPMTTSMVGMPSNSRFISVFISSAPGCLSISRSTSLSTYGLYGSITSSARQ